jgi:hypothetical protein
VAVFPLDAPRYGMVVSLDGAKANAKTYGFAPAGWMAAPVISHLVQEIAPLLGVMSPPEAESLQQIGLKNSAVIQFLLQ